MSERRVMAWCTVSIDGYSSGPGGPGHDTWLYEHVMQPATGEYFEGIWRGCSTALMGRSNYLGFHTVWPGITEDPATNPRTRDLGRWLCSVEKGVVSTTLPEPEATWENTRVFRDVGKAVATLKAEPGRGILVLNSATLIQSMLAAGLVDDLRLVVVPVLLGGGLRLLPDGVSVAWDLASSTTLPDGALGVHYQRR
ncbi:MAG: dihydrofolate reductase family protein [Streptosporangiaceae bacterium]|jgi:dihydrofolate reductase